MRKPPLPKSEDDPASHRTERTRSVRRFAAVATIAALSLGVAAVSAYQNYFPKRFAAVVEGRLYRSGGVSPAQLERVTRKYHIRTVLCLLNSESAEADEERAAAERLGLKWLNVSLPGNGDSTPAQREQIKKLLSDESLSPLLVHCAAGANRTGLAVGLYRIREQGWSLDQVMAELRAFDFEDLPKHQNLRDALAAEAAAVAPRSPETQPAQDP